MSDYNLRFPIGEFTYNKSLEPSISIEEISKFPEQLRMCLKDVKPEQLGWKYRQGGWTVKQVVHHCADSHINAYTRFKVALTENGKTITPYDENAWTNLKEVEKTPIEVSLQLLDYLHVRWINCLETIEDWSPSYHHPGDNALVSMHEAVQMYSWHSRHHLGHIKLGLSSEGKWS